MSFTCSSNQIHNSADVFESSAAEVASPTRAHGMRYCNKSGKRMCQMIRWNTQNIFGIKDLPCRSTLLLVVMCQPTVASRRQMKVNIRRQPKAQSVNNGMRVWSMRYVFTIMKFWKKLKFRCRSVFIFPGWREVETMPWFPYRWANSFDTWIFPYDYMNIGVRLERENGPVCFGYTTFEVLSSSSLGHPLKCWNRYHCSAHGQLKMC